MFCLALFSLAKILTGSRIAGHIGAASIYFSFTLRRYLPGLRTSMLSYNLFTFTLFPHASSGMELVEITAQMYSGLRSPRNSTKHRLYFAERVTRPGMSHPLGLAAMLIASTIRFRGRYLSSSCRPSFNHVICNVLEKISALRFGRCVSIAGCRSF